VIFWQKMSASTDRSSTRSVIFGRLKIGTMDAIKNGKRTTGKP
jgi:hypothetical protein